MIADVENLTDAELAAELATLKPHSALGWIYDARANGLASILDEDGCNLMLAAANKLPALVDERDDLRREVAQLGADLDNMAARETAALRAEVERLEQELDDAQSNARTAQEIHNEAAAQWHAEVERLTAEVADVRAAFDELAAIKRQEMQALLEEAQTAGHAALRQVCGWCVQAAGGDQAAHDAAPRYTRDEVRAHTLSCPHNPLVMRAERAEAVVVTGVAAMLNDFAIEAEEADDQPSARTLADARNCVLAGAWRSKCDGDHGEPACSDATCWQRDSEEVNRG